MSQARGQAYSQLHIKRLGVTTSQVDFADINQSYVNVVYAVLRCKHKQSLDS